MKYIKQELSLTCMDLGSQAGAKTHFFSEFGHVAHEIKGKRIQQHGSKYFSSRHMLGSSGGIKTSLHVSFLKVIMMHIKLKGIDP